MSEFTDQQDAIAAARRSMIDEQMTLQRIRHRLHSRQARLDDALRTKSETDADVVGLRTEIADLSTALSNQIATLDAANAALLDARTAVPLFRRPNVAVRELNDAVPIVMLPIRVETRFMSIGTGTELWLRFFPDDIAISHHDPVLTTDEFEAGKHYWTEIWRARQLADEAETTARERGAWRALAGHSGGPRAAWISNQCEPSDLSVADVKDLQFGSIVPDDLALESWARAPRSNVMPDQFVVMAESVGQPIQQIGNMVPDPLFTGPDPLASEDELLQQDGELTAGRPIQWMYDFDTAVEAGMAMRIPLTADQARHGIDRLFVLGVRLSSNVEATRTLVEELFSDHQYSPDGLALVPQGTPTNNTDSERSAFAIFDIGAEQSFAALASTEANGDAAAGDPREQSDLERLTRAFGISSKAMMAIGNTGQFDIRDAHRVNKALWAATGGYYLEDMLGLTPETTRRVQRFFTSYVTARGPLPAIRVADQPYGILPATSFRQWQFNDTIDDATDLPMMQTIFTIASRISDSWRGDLSKVSRVGKTSDGLSDLIETLGLHAASAEFHRRHAVGRQYRWNFLRFAGDANLVTATDSFYLSAAQRLKAELGFSFAENPRIFDLTFFEAQDVIADPLVDDVRDADNERLLENHFLNERYQTSNGSGLGNYIDWLVDSSITALRQQALTDENGQPLPVPRPLLYRMLRRALLLTYHDAAMQLYESEQVATTVTRRELELINIDNERTVTRWEFVEANMAAVLPNVSNANVSVADFLNSNAGLQRPETTTLKDVQDCLRTLAALSTAALERLFVEHIDLCSYRLDAWQTAFVTQRLAGLRRDNAVPPSEPGGLYLGAFGYLENISAAAPLVAASDEEVPTPLRSPAGEPIFKQPENDGFIAAPSVSHAATAAVLRNAYLSHRNDGDADAMAVDLSSERVRAALALIEGVRNGQDLGSLLGYQFERGLHDRYDDPTLEQYLLPFRNAFPLLADKITQNEDGTQIESKEARNVFDGYALVEKAFLSQNPVPYPYGVAGLPPDDHLPLDGEQTSPVVAIKSEVERMRQSFDALSDLGLAEGVFQMVQGNYERGSAVLQALTRGDNPPDPEVIRTSRSGTAVTHRIVIHVDPDGSARAWPADATPRSILEPGTNQFLADLLGPPDKLRFIVSTETGGSESMSVHDLALQPIDLMHLAADLASPTRESMHDVDGSILEKLIDVSYRKTHPGNSEPLTIVFSKRDTSWGADDKSFFEFAPLLNGLRDLLIDARPLTGEDLELSSEAALRTDAGAVQLDLVDARTRVTAVLDRLRDQLPDLSTAIADAASGGEAQQDALLLEMRKLSGYALADSLSADRETVQDTAESLFEQAAVLVDRVDEQLQAAENQSLSNNERVDILILAAKALVGSEFSFLPQFVAENTDELKAAADFRDMSTTQSLTRFSAAKTPLIVDEWLQGVARVRQKARSLEQILMAKDAFGVDGIEIKPLQLPHRPGDHWIAVEYPETDPNNPGATPAFDPEGDFLSIVQLTANGQFDPSQSQKGIVVDEWVEVIPGKTETAGIAAHFNQPGTAPPQAMLLAVSPTIDGSWNWDDILATVRETIDRSRLRALEPEHLSDTAYAHILPAILTAVSTDHSATISTDLIYSSEMAFDSDRSDN